jgi:hypothetical protein
VLKNTLEGEGKSSAGFLRSPDNLFRLMVAGVLVLALALRIIALLSLKDTAYYDVLLADERTYHEWAMEIAAGTYAATTVPDFAALPADVMAAVYRLFSPDPLYVRMLNILIGVTTCGFMILAGTALSNRTVGLVCGLVASLYEPFIFFSITVHKTALSSVAQCGSLFTGTARRVLTLSRTELQGFRRTWNHTGGGIQSVPREQPLERDALLPPGTLCLVGPIGPGCALHDRGKPEAEPEAVSR